MGESESTSRWVELVREDERAESTEFVYAFEWLQTSHYILLNNVRELLAIPERFASDRSLRLYENHAGRETLILEFVRRLHNYLAAVKTLVDHTRTFRSRHVSTPSFDSECGRRLQQLRDTPVVKFLQEFRNPVLHSQLPRVALTTTDQGGQLRRQLTLSVAETLAMHSWSVSARQYIDEAQEGYYADNKYIDLTAASERYQTAIGGFYDWFYASVAAVKKEQIAEFATRRAELVRLQAALTKTPPPDAG